MKLQPKYLLFACKFFHHLGTLERGKKVTGSPSTLKFMIKRMDHYDIRQDPTVRNVCC